MQLTYYGHSCFSIVSGGKKILFDPFITPNELAKNINISGIEADYILVSHGHADHIADCVMLAKQTGATVIGAFEVTEWLAKQGVEKYHPMNTGGQRTFDFGKLRCTSAIHSSAMPDGSYGANPMGFLVTMDNRSFYYSGDTALTMDCSWFQDGPNPILLFFRWVIISLWGMKMQLLPLNLFNVKRSLVYITIHLVI
jgi:L-ascorbate metabolism protein UlaG (beta-lactamase superfamily)